MQRVLGSHAAAAAFGRAASGLLVLDAALIGAFVVASVMVGRGALDEVPFMLRIRSDGSLGEVANYGKWACISTWMLTRWRRLGDPMGLTFAVVFAIVLADDMLQLHEAMGDALAHSIAIPDRLGLEPDDIGELGGLSLLGLAVVAVLSWGGRRTSRGNRPAFLVMTGVLGALIFCGVVLDLASAMAEGLLGDSAPVTTIVQTAEDGGEMVFGSIACALAWALRPRFTSPARS